MTDPNDTQHDGPNQPDRSAGSSARRWLTRTVIVLGLVSLFTDMATEMIIPFLPVFVTSVLGAGPTMLGVVEGFADAISSILKLVSGRWADKIGRQRPFVLAGYTIASVVRPFVAAATSAWHVVAVRSLDRVGKGLRTSPRDSMLAASVEESKRGKAFGFHRAMDHAGAVLGPLIAIAVITWWTTDLRTLFWLTAIPGALAVLTIVIGLRRDDERPTVTEEVEKPEAKQSLEVSKDMRRRLARVLIPIGVFTLGNATDLFLLLKAGGQRASLETFPLLWIALHIVKMLASIPGGSLADKLGSRRTIIAGWLIYAAIYLGFSLASQQWVIWVLFVTYGLYYGLTEGAEKALISRIAPAEIRGTAFGWYHITVGLMALPASIGFGAVWAWLGNTVAFSISAGLALVAAVLLWWLAPRGGAIE